MDNGGTQTNGPKDKKIDDYAQGLHAREDIDYMCQEKKEDCIDAWIQRQRTTLRRANKD